MRHCRCTWEASNGVSAKWRGNASEACGCGLCPKPYNVATTDEGLARACSISDDSETHGAFLTAVPTI